MAGTNGYRHRNLLRILIAIVPINQWTSIPQYRSMINTANFSPNDLIEEMSCFQTEPPILGCFLPEGVAMEWILIIGDGLTEFCPSIYNMDDRRPEHPSLWAQQVAKMLNGLKTAPTLALLHYLTVYIYVVCVCPGPRLCRVQHIC